MDSTLLCSSRYHHRPENVIRIYSLLELIQGGEQAFSLDVGGKPQTTVLDRVKPFFQETGGTVRKHVRLVTASYSKFSRRNPRIQLEYWGRAMCVDGRKESRQSSFSRKASIVSHEKSDNFLIIFRNYNSALFECSNSHLQKIVLIFNKF